MALDGRRAAAGLLFAQFLVLSSPAFAAVFVRVGLCEGLGRSAFGCSVPARLIDAEGRSVAEVGAMGCWYIEGARNRARVYAPDGRNYSCELPVSLRPIAAAPAVPPPLVFLAGKWYRGEGEFRPGLTVINRLPLEQYLYGVVPSEMPASWPSDSLKAQAIAARTYAIANLGSFSRQGFDLRPTIDNQVYSGASSERVTSNLAVDSTRGEVVTYNGKVIRAYYHSCAGGYTESSESVWGRAIPYLQAVPDYDQDAPRYTWQRTFTTGELSSLLRVGEVHRLLPLQRGTSGRVTRLQVVGSRGSRIYTGEQFRKATKLFSTLFSVQATGSGFLFSGRGFGHGLGLSQWGAKALGERGYAYSQILQHYYPSATLSRLSEGS